MLRSGGAATLGANTYSGAQTAPWFNATTAATGYQLAGVNALYDNGSFMVVNTHEGGTGLILSTAISAINSNQLLIRSAASATYVDIGSGGMAVTTNIIALSTTAVAAGANTQAFIKASTTANFGIYYGSGAPGFTAAANSLYVRTDGSTTTTRLYVNTTGASTWATFTTSA